MGSLQGDVESPGRRVRGHATVRSASGDYRRHDDAVKVAPRGIVASLSRNFAASADAGGRGGGGGVGMSHGGGRTTPVQVRNCAVSPGHSNRDRAAPGGDSVTSRRIQPVGGKDNRVLSNSWVANRLVPTSHVDVCSDRCRHAKPDGAGLPRQHQPPQLHHHQQQTLQRPHQHHQLAKTNGDVRQNGDAFPRHRAASASSRESTTSSSILKKRPDDARQHWQDGYVCPADKMSADVCYQTTSSDRPYVAASDSVDSVTSSPRHRRVLFKNNVAVYRFDSDGADSSAYSSTSESSERLHGEPRLQQQQQQQPPAPAAEHYRQHHSHPHHHRRSVTGHPQHHQQAPVTSAPIVTDRARARHRYADAQTAGRRKEPRERRARSASATPVNGDDRTGARYPYGGQPARSATDDEFDGYGHDEPARPVAEYQLIDRARPTTVLQQQQRHSRSRADAGVGARTSYGSTVARPLPARCPVQAPAIVRVRYAQVADGNCKRLILSCSLQPCDQFDPDGIVVKANRAGTRVRIVFCEDSMGNEGPSDQLILPVAVDPYQLTARVDPDLTLVIEAPLYQQ